MSARAKSVSQEIDRDTRRLLVRLAGGASLRRAGHRLVLALAPDRGGFARELEVSQALIERCLGSDWLEQRGDKITLSEVGRAWLRRCAAGDDGFQQQHQLRSMQEREAEGVRRSLLVNEAESPLGWLRRRKDRNGRPLMTDQVSGLSPSVIAVHKLAFFNIFLSACFLYVLVVSSRRAYYVLTERPHVGP